VVLGIFALNTTAVQGAIIQNINHGLSTGALFLIVGMIYDRRHTRMISEFGGLSSVMPVFAVMFMIATFSSIGLPGLNGFVGEFLILMGAFNSEVLDNMWFGILGTTGVILAAVYMLWMFQRVMFGPVTKDENKNLKDLNAREIGLLVPVMVFIVWIGIYPSYFTGFSEVQVETILDQSKDKAQAILQQSHQTDLPKWAGKLYDVTPEFASLID
jgi:NADH-quinone oxidoreductase subunit M